MFSLFNPLFILNQVLILIILCLVQYGTGLLVKYKNVKVNYTRKINHFLSFLLPVLLNWGYVHEESAWLLTVGALLAVSRYACYIKPVRDRIPFIKVMFISFDRPEDRPYTLLWIVTQTAAGYLVMIPMGLLFAHHDLLHLIFIPILIYGIGDGLAEPVGVRFGRHKYTVFALFSNKKYTRSLEGSACVF